MPYGIIKVDQVTFTNAGVDQTISVSGIVASISGNITATGTISGNVIRGGTTVSGATVTGTAGQFGTITGNTAGFTTVTGTTVTGTTATFTSGVFTNISGGTHTVTSGVFASGTAANPSITFQGDLNTGIYSPGADQVAVATNGTGRLFVDASGNVGIGATPNSYAGYSTLTINNTSGSELDFEVNGTLTSDIYTDSTGTYWTTRTAVPIALRTNSTERLRITSAGLVGVGTSSPVSTLTVNGIGAFGANSGSADVSAARELYIRGAGNSSLISFQTSSTGSNGFLVGQIADQARIQVVDAHPLTFHTSNTERVRIDSSGNVGIGTSSPASKLTVAGTQGNYRVDPDSVSNEVQLLTTVPDNSGFRNYRIRSNQLFVDTSGATALTIDSSQRVGIGTTGPLGLLDLGAADSATALAIANWRAASYNGSILQWGGITASQWLAAAFFTAGSERARIDSSGRLLVGTSSTSANTRIVAVGNSFGGNGRIDIDCDTATPANGDALGYIVFGDSGQSNGAWVGADRDGGTWSGSSKPSRLVFSTTADGASSPTERMRITSAGNVGIGSTPDPSFQLTINGNSAGVAPGILFTDSAASPRNFAFYINGSKNLVIRDSTASSDRLTIDSSGRLLVGTSSASSAAGFGTPNNQFVGDYQKSSILLRNNQSDNTSCGIVFQKIRDTSIVQQNDPLGYLTFNGYDGVTDRAGAYIYAEIDGTPGSGDLPTRLVFSTTSDGASSPTERMRITSAGLVGVGTTAPFDALDVKPSANRHIVITSNASYANNGIVACNDSGSEIALGIAGSPLQFFTQAAERARIDSSGRLLVGTSSVISNNYGGTAGRLQVANNDYLPIGFFTYNNTAGETGFCPYLELNRARGTQATPTTVANGDDLGLINFYGHDGSTFIRAATIKSVADDIPGTNDMPGRLVFGTTSDGASSPTARIIINSGGTLYPATDNAYQAGGGGFRWTAIYAVNGTIQTSDARQKTDVSSCSLGSAFIKSLQPVSFKWIEGGNTVTKSEDGETDVITAVPGERTHWGFLAQDVKAAVDDAGVDFGGWILTDKNDPDSAQGLRYDQFIAPLTKALQEALTEIDVLKVKVAALEAS